MTEQSEQPKVRTFIHSRKGKIVGVVTKEDDTWMDVRLVGDQTLTYISGDGDYEDGEEVTVRKSYCREVTV